MRRMSAPSDVGFALLRPQHQLGQRRLGACGRPRAPPASAAVIGSSTPWRAPSSRAAWAVRTPSATMRCPRRTSSSERPRPSSMPTWRLRLRCPVQVSTRSPSPLRPASVSGPAAHRGGQARDLDEAAGDERGHRVVAEAEALDDARGDRDDVLQRAADLDAGDVVGRVEPQRRPAELLLDEARGVGGRRRHDDRRRQPGRDLGRERRPGQHRDRPRRPGLVGDHLRHPEERAVLEALGRADERHRTPARPRRRDAPRRAGPATAPRRPPAWRRRRRPRSTAVGWTPSTRATPGR